VVARRARDDRARERRHPAPRGARHADRPRIIDLLVEAIARFP